MPCWIGLINFHILTVQGGTRPRLAEDVSLETIGHDARLDGYTGADLSFLVKKSAILAIEEFFLNNNSESSTQPIDTRVHLRHFHATMENIRPSVSKKVNAIDQSKKQHIANAMLRNYVDGCLISPWLDY